MTVEDQKLIEFYENVFFFFLVNNKHKIFVFLFKDDFSY